MRRFSTILVALAAIGCGSDPGPAAPAPAPGPAVPPPTADGASLEGPVEVVLDHGQVVEVEGTGLRLAFEDVLGDSRCPVDVDCIWEGNAEVELALGDGSGPPDRLRLNTAVEPRSAVARGLRLTLLEVSPDPVSTAPIALEDYAIRLRLEAAP